jgi:hypothetical protein
MTIILSTEDLLVVVKYVTIFSVGFLLGGVVMSYQCGQCLRGIK